MTNEKLIEDAAIAIHSVAEGGASWFDARMTDKAQHRTEARAALAVFEKALGEATFTPTDDEREALIAEGRDWEGALESATARDIVRRLTDALAAGNRRTEVPSDDAWLAGERSVADAAHYAANPEPSANHAYRGNRSQDTCWVEVGGEMCRKPVEAHTEPQGEPSDAQVLAALNSYEAWSPEESLDMWGTDQADRMRAALRAAWGVR